MSVKELTFKCEDCGGIHAIKFDEAEDLIFEHNNHMLFLLNRSEAHLLMLFLQEHLNKPALTVEVDDAITDELNNRPKNIIG